MNCGFDDNTSLGTLQMLGNIESKLEELLAGIAQMPQDFVETAEKAREKERRQTARGEKMATQRREQERRIQRSLERAQAPVKKHIGKPVMFRSRLVKPKKQTESSESKKEADEEEELRAFLARDC